MSTQPDSATQLPEPPDKLFTLEEANRALPYVARVVEDVVGHYRRANALNEQLEALRDSDDLEAARKLQRQLNQAVDDLERCVEELRAMGIELKDYEAVLVDFPALHEGREICLCWKQGEPEILAWHEIDAGYAGRQDVSQLGDQASA